MGLFRVSVTSFWDIARASGTLRELRGSGDTATEASLPYPPLQPAKTNADVELPLSAVQTALPEPEYPASLQGKSNAPTPCREQSGRSGRARRQQTGAKAARLRTRRACSAPADQVTATVPPVMVETPVPVPVDLSLFGMSIEAQVAAAGTGARAMRLMGPVSVVRVLNFVSFATAGTQQYSTRLHKSLYSMPTSFDQDPPYRCWWHCQRSHRRT